MSDPKLIQSALSRTVREDGTEVRIDIYRLETTDWSLEGERQKVWGFMRL